MIKKFDNFINEGKAWDLSLSDKQLELLRTIISDNVKEVVEIVKEHKMEDEFKDLIYKLKRARVRYWAEDDFDETFEED